MFNKFLGHLIALSLLFGPSSLVLAYVYEGVHWHSEQACWKFDTNLPNAFTTPTGYAAETTWNVGAPSSFAFNYNTSCGNKVYYLNIDGPGGKVAEAWIYYNLLTKHLIETNFKYDSSEPWHTDVYTLPPSTKFDAWSIAAHEFGHWLTLEHSGNCPSSPTDSTPTMCSGVRTGQSFQRTLASDDKNGIWNIYDATHTP